jgi:hypothetical protein
MGGVLKKNTKIKWSANFAYAIGLIASDGFMSKDGRHIGLSSSEIEMIDNFKTALNINAKTIRHARGGETDKKYLMAIFSDKNFYNFLINIGITPAKSKTIKSVKITDKYFGDFLRGLFDGDGTSENYQDKRWPNSYGFKISFASASLVFLNWLKINLTRLYRVKGFIRKGKGVFILKYTKGDSKSIFKVMYRKSDALYLKRKYRKLMNAIDVDVKFGLPYLQRHRNATVA